MDATPVTIWPEKRDEPAAVVIVTLWGTAWSAFENLIPNGWSAGALSDAGANWKSRASRARTTGFEVGCAVGFVVGLDVGFAVGFGVGPAGRVGAAVAVGFGLAVGRDVGLAVGVAAGGDSDGAALAGGLAVAVATGLAVTLEAAVGDGDGDSVATAPKDEPGPTEAGTVPAQAATKRATASSRATDKRDIAAL